ncbi:hypothetical protein JCM17960_14670 [Magnetospira thiophila]
MTTQPRVKYQQAAEEILLAVRAYCGRCPSRPVSLFPTLQDIPPCAGDCPEVGPLMGYAHEIKANLAAE